MNTTAPWLRLTAEDLPSVQDDGGRCELVQADVVREPPAGAEHGTIAGRIHGFLFVFVEERALGRVCPETGFVLQRDPDTVRAPDVAFVSSERTGGRRRRGPYFEGAPDLAVEVLSPSNAAREIEEKVREYFGAGGRAVWVVDPPRREVTIHLPGSVPRRLSKGDTLDGAPVLPGFRLPVAEIFGPTR